MDIYFINLNLSQDIIENKIILNKVHHKMSRLFLKYILETGYNIHSPEILIKNKKPYLEDNLIYFSISHSNSVIGIAFDVSNIGFDIEYKKNRNIKSLLKHYGLENNNITEEEFYQMWTVYEAEYKSGEKINCISFNYKNYMCSISCKNQKIDKIFEIKVLTDFENLKNQEYIKKIDYNLEKCSANDINILSNLKLKIGDKIVN